MEASRKALAAYLRKKLLANAVPGSMHEDIILYLSDDELIEKHTQHHNMKLDWIRATT